MFGGALVVHLAVIGGWALVRGIDQDEGFYLLAGRQVLEGLRLYTDAFFPQMPYLPWLEAAVFTIAGGPSLPAGRFLSVVPGAMTGALVTLLVWRQTRSRMAAAAGAVLSAFNGTLLNALAVVKTYGLANLGIVTAVGLVVSRRRDNGWLGLVAGLAAGFAVGVRWPAIAVAAVLAVVLLRTRSCSFLPFLAGVAVALLPLVLAVIRGPEEFWFCNVTFHEMRREISGWDAVLLQKAQIAARWFFLPQHAVLWALAAWGLVTARRVAAVPAACAVVLTAGYAWATPTYVHYAAQFLPLLIAAGGPALLRLGRHPALLGPLVLGYILAVYPAVRPVPPDHPLAAKREQWSLETVGAVADYVRAHTPPDGVVLSWWSGYPVLAGRREVRGVGFWESNVARKIPPAAARRFHVLQSRQVRAIIERGVPAAIVTADWAWQEMRDTMAAGYERTFSRAGVEVWLRRGAKKAVSRGDWPSSSAN